MRRGGKSRDENFSEASHARNPCDDKERKIDQECDVQYMSVANTTHDHYRKRPTPKLLANSQTAIHNVTLDMKSYFAAGAAGGFLPLSFFDSARNAISVRTCGRRGISASKSQLREKAKNTYPQLFSSSWARPSLSTSLCMRTMNISLLVLLVRQLPSTNQSIAGGST